MPKIKAKTLRILTITIIVLVVILGAACKAGFGNLCSLGTAKISYICPLGFLQASLANRTFLPQLWLPIVLVLLSIILLGRFFCGWICPTALLKEVFKVNGTNSKIKEKAENTHADNSLSAPAANSNYTLEQTPKQAFRSFDSRYAVLGGALISSFVFGFPVFCLICPIGLFFGFLFAVIRLFTIQQPSLELLLFPLLLGLEIFVLKSWCRSICPLGALLSLLSKLNPFFRPVIKTDKCLAAKGINCQVCHKACPEGIDLRNQNITSDLNDCTKCLECSEQCPEDAIKFPVKA